MGSQLSHPVPDPDPVHIPSSTTKVEVPHSTPSSIFSGTDVEEQSFTWTIGNFHEIRKEQELIDSQRIDLTVWHPTGQSTKWTVSLVEDQFLGPDGRRWIRWIGVNVSLWNSDRTTYRSRFQFTIKNRNGEVIREAETGLMYGSGASYDRSHSQGYLENFIEADQDDDDLCHWGSLVINIRVKMYSPSQTQLLSSVEAVEVIQEEFQVRFLERFQKDLADVLKCPDACADIKIVANDGKEFTMKRGILAVRSDVFAAMLNCDMMEATSGVINLPDISSKALMVLLNFLATGKLLPEWRDAEVLPGLTNAAAKFQLQDLLQFLDLTIGKVCKVENVKPLIIIARQLSLKVAEEELMKFVRKEGVGSADNFIQICNSELPLTGEESDEPKAKRQKRF